MNAPDLAALLKIAEDIAAEAGEALRTHRSAWSDIEAVEGREVKINGDKRAEAIILPLLQAKSDIAILSEEAGWVGAQTDDLAWAVDPLDGSVNYIQGFPHCAVSIALMRGRRPVLGVVDCFLLGERFSGAVGLGAKLNDAPIAVSRVADPKAGILNTGIPARAATDGAAFSSFMADMLRWRKVRMIGSAASALAYVASGRADAYRETGAMLWDVAAGCALVEAAGGKVTIQGAALDKPLIVTATNAALANVFSA